MVAALALAAVVASMAHLPPSSAPLVFKSPGVTYGSHFAFALDDAGKIWTRALEGGEWVLLGGTGLPFGEEQPKAGLRIVTISADSTGLVAIDADGRIYDAEIEDAVAGKIHWNFRWGNPWRIGAVPVSLPKEPYRVLTYSLLNREGFYQEDIDGNPHTIERIDTLWLLDSDGRRLRYDDPWLPTNTFEFWISSPEHGAVELQNVQASGSTLFGIDAAGNLYTRLIDFDTMGGNPGITYSFLREKRGYEAEGTWAIWRGRMPIWLDVRSLPAEEWKPQPRVPGKITTRLGIVQTGKGNAARELRVEGEDADGHTGYWKKAIFDSAWTFVPTGAPLEGTPIAADAQATKHAPFGESLDGTARIDVPGEPRQELAAHLEGFDTFHDPSRLSITTVRGVKLAFTVYTRPDPWAWKLDQKKRLNAGLVADESSLQSREAKDAFHELFGDMKTEDIFVTVWPDKLRIESIAQARTDGKSLTIDFDRPQRPQ